MPELPQPLQFLMHRRVAVGVAAVLMPLFTAGAIFTGGESSARTPTRPAAGLSPVTTPMPTPTATPTNLGRDKALFALIAAAAKRPAASAPVHRLPHLNIAAMTASGIPGRAYAAYVAAARAVGGCDLHWWVLAGIGEVESGHAHSGGSANPRWNGVAKPPIYGPVLDGSHHWAAIPDTDHGVLDGDKHWDRAVGPMQFLPTTWEKWGRDAHGRLQNPQAIRPAALAAARYLCAGGGQLSTNTAMAAAVYSYNHSFDYVRLVLSVAARYAGMTPAELGVDNLPHDKVKKNKHKHHDAKKHRHHKAAQHRHRGSAAASARPSPTASGSSRPGPAPSSSPAKSPSPSPSRSPSPSPSPTPIVPLPTPTPPSPSLSATSTLTPSTSP